VKRHVAIRVNGRVQGVLFRAHAKETADQLGVTGFVRNEPDGSVYIEAEGAPRDLERFIIWCRKGPPSAIVKGVDVSDGPDRRFAEFSISF